MKKRKLSLFLICIIVVTFVMIVAISRIGYYNDGIRLIHFSRRLIDKLQMNSAISGDLKVCSQHLFNQLGELGLTTHRKNNVTNKVDCRSYHRSGIIEPEFRIDVLKSEAIANRNTVTLVTHLTSDRVEKLLDIMTTWTGPVSASVYVKNMTDLNLFVNKICSSYIENRWKNFQIHFIKEDAEVYPVNCLRNIAMDQAQSDFLFILDVDLVSMPNAYETLITYTRKTKLNKREVFIVAAFEVPQEISFDMNEFPRNKEELLVKWRHRDIIPFFENGFTKAYKPTKYEKWKNATQPYQVEWKRWYEPYVVIRKDSTPKFDQRFVGRAYDKSSYIMQLHAMKFKFLVLPDLFIVHTPHSLNNANWFRAMGLYRCAAGVEKSFIQLLGKQYKFRIRKQDIQK